MCLSCSEFVRGALTYSLLPTYGRTVLGFAVEWTALSLSVMSMVDSLLRSPIGWVVDKFGERPTLVVGSVISTAAVFIMSRIHSIPLLLVCTAVYGLGVSPLWPSAVSAIGIATPETKRASFMGYLYLFWLAGTGLGPVLINFVIGRTYHVAFAILIAVGGLAFLLAWLMVRRPKDARVATIPTRSNSPMRRALYWRSLWRNVKDLLFLFPGMFAQTFAVAMLVPILSLYAKVVLHISAALYSTILVFAGAIVVVLLLPAGKLVDRFGPRKFMVAGFIVAGLALGVYPFYHRLWTTYVAMGLLGFCYAFILPAWNSILDHSIDADKKATLWGVFMTVEGLGSALGPYLGGILWDAINPSAPFWVSAGVIFIMGVLYMMLPIETRRNDRKQGPRRRMEAPS